MNDQEIILYLSITIIIALLNLFFYYLFLKLKWKEVLLENYNELKKDKKKLNKLRENFIKSCETELLIFIPISFIPLINVIPLFFLLLGNFYLLIEFFNNENSKYVSNTYAFFLKISRRILRKIIK